VHAKSMGVVSSEAQVGHTDSFKRARQLALTREQPILALKAYGVWMRTTTVSSRMRAFGLLDFSLYCNKFAMEQRNAQEADPNLRLARARDYFQLVLDAFADMYQIYAPELTTSSVSDQAEGATVIFSTKPPPAALLAVLQISLHNWAWLEMSEGSDRMVVAQKLLAAGRQVEEQMLSSSFLGWPWEVVCNITSAVRAVMRCDLTAAETASRKAVDLVYTNATTLRVVDGAASSGRDANEVAGDIALLKALSYYTLGVAIESSACEESFRCYESALAHVSESHSAGVCQSVMEKTREQLAHYIDEERYRERMHAAAEEAAAAAQVDRRGRSTARVRKAQGAKRRSVGRMSNSRPSVSGQNVSPIVAPPLPEPLRFYLSEHGLSTLATSVGSFRGVFHVLGYSLPGYSADGPLPSTLFEGTRFEASATEAIFAVPLCTSTLLQWTLCLREAANQPPATFHRSVWSPRPPLASLLTELAAQRPPGPKSVSASQTRKEIVEGNSKLRQQVLQLFAPPTATSKVKQNAHESVETVVQLLGQRLGVLLKTERAFEDHWTATERVLSALQSYTLSQDLVHLKRTLAAQQRLRHMRRERSARTILHFFRDIVRRRARRAEQSTVDQERFTERDRATVVLQKYTRRWLACREARRRVDEQAEYVRKVVLVLSLARRRSANAKYDLLRKAREQQATVEGEQTRQAYAALQIQRVYRGHCSRLRCYHLRGLHHEMTLHHLRDSRNYYATLIQKRARGMLVRRQYGTVVQARRFYGRNVYRRELWERSCVAIQRAFRAHRLRRANGHPSTLTTAAYYLPGEAVLRGPLACGNMAGVSAGNTDEDAAAQCIQDAYRSCIAKRRLEALKYARLANASSKEEVDRAHARPFSLKECVF
jgi:hypothetical protein